MIAELPLDAKAADVVERGRDEVRAIMDGVDDRLLVIVGPCSIHDPKAGLEYARRLVSQAEKHKEDLLMVMRAYFEKPRTTVGWKGLINDPHLDGSHDIAAGLRAARSFLQQVTALGLPTATEFLEPISPQYMADLISWGAIGARTTESQIHRQLASGLSMPIGFKNGTDGDLQVAIDACGAAAAAQAFLGIDGDGRAALVSTAGNPDTHVILRGGRKGPNYSAADVEAASARLAAKKLNPRLIVDASHANSGKSHHRQAEVALEIGAQLEDAGRRPGRSPASCWRASWWAARRTSTSRNTPPDARTWSTVRASRMPAWSGMSRPPSWSSWPHPPGNGGKETTDYPNDFHNGHMSI